MNDLVGAVLPGTTFLVLVILTIYLVASNSQLLLIVGVCALLGGTMGYVAAGRAGREYRGRW